MTIKQPEYGFLADINHYMPETGLEELTTSLRMIGEETTYDGTIREIDRMIEDLKWWKDNLDNNAPYEPCHKDRMAYARMAGE